jgi:hypothetical protein
MMDVLDIQRMAILQSVIDKKSPGIKRITAAEPELLLITLLLDRFIEERRRHFEPEIEEAWQPEDWRCRLRERFPGLDGGFDHGPGWADLIAAGAQMCADSGEVLRMSYAKEKYGRLSLFTSSYFEGDLEGLDEAMEALSEHVCEDCGAPGRNRATRGWMRTQCDRHFAERQS